MSKQFFYRGGFSRHLFLSRLFFPSRISQSYHYFCSLKKLSNCFLWSFLEILIARTFFRLGIFSYFYKNFSWAFFPKFFPEFFLEFFLEFFRNFFWNFFGIFFEIFSEIFSEFFSEPSLTRFSVFIMPFSPAVHCLLSCVVFLSLFDHFTHGNWSEPLPAAAAATGYPENAGFGGGDPRRLSFLYDRLVMNRRETNKPDAAGMRMHARYLLSRHTRNHRERTPAGFMSAPSSSSADKQGKRDHTSDQLLRKLSHRYLLNRLPPRFGW